MRPRLRKLMAPVGVRRRAGRALQLQAGARRRLGLPASPPPAGGPALVAVVGGDGRAARATVPARRARVVEVRSPGEAAALVAPGEDLVLLAGDAEPLPGWFEALQHGAYGALGEGVGLVAGMVLGADGRIESAGLQLVPGDGPGRRFAGAPASLPAAHATQTVLGADPACLYVTAGALAALGGEVSDPIAYALAAWERGIRVAYAHGAVVRRSGPPPAPLPFARPRRAAGGARRIVYVTQDTGMGGGHRVVFNHLDGLRARGHDTELWTLAPGGPDWFALETPVRSFGDYPSLMRALRDVDAVKVATWWETAAWVWEASVTRGTGAFFVQDIETTYYRDPAAVHEAERRKILASYRPELRFLTTSQWVGGHVERLSGAAPEYAPPGIEDRWFDGPGGEVEREPDVVLGLGRSNPLKNFPLTREAYLALGEPRPRLWLFGSEPELGEGLGDRVTYHVRPSDEEVAGLLARATVFVQTSAHEGYCLPIVEAMAAGVPVVCTDAHGNQDFCVDGVNCLMPEATPAAVAEAIARLLGDADLRERLVAEGRRTAEEHRWGPRLDALDAYFRALD